MNSRKIEIVKNRITFINVRNIQIFSDFANYYRFFVRNFSEIASLITKLIRKNAIFVWFKKCEKVFQTLKYVFISEQILLHYDSDKESIVLRSIVYFSKKLSSQDCNYEIYDKELLTIIKIFEKWRSELKDVVFSIKVISNHRNLEYFMTIKQLSRRQTRWVEYLFRFNFKIIYRLDK